MNVSWRSRRCHILLPRAQAAASKSHLTTALTGKGPLEEPLRDCHSFVATLVVIILAEGETVFPDETPNVGSVRKPVSKGPPANCPVSVGERVALEEA